MISIDVIVPSYRLQSEYLISIVKMDIPDETHVRYFIIADNPEIEIPQEFASLIDNTTIHVIRNMQNMGVCLTRNVGIDNATADWVLFIDDDVKPAKDLLLIYTHAIREKPEEIGFFGQVLFPKPINHFTKGLAASVILTFFTAAKRISHLKWAPTPNVLIKRSVIGSARFNETFDKFGASEEIDFFLKINRISGKELCAIPNATVYHNWWYNGKRNYSRFFRWAGGFTLLIDYFPEYSFYSFPNLIENLILGLLILIPVSIVLHSSLLLTCFLTGSIIGECTVEFVHLLFTKGLRKSLYTVESMLVRASMDIGKLSTQYKYHKIFHHFCKRFDHFCNGKRLGRLRRLSGFRFFLYVFFTIVLYSILHK